MAYKRHSRAEERRRSAVALVKMLLRERDVLAREHLIEALNLALWKLTEAEAGKYQTRFRSVEPSATNRKVLRHDHVFQRKRMVDDLLEAVSPEAVDDILKKAVGCTITKDEHTRLNQFKDLDGWVRYQRAGITVVDAVTGKPFAEPSQASGINRILNASRFGPYRIVAPSAKRSSPDRCPAYGSPRLTGRRARGS
jgi:hypothetical protein